MTPLWFLLQSAAEKSQEGFFGWQTAAWVIVPMVIVAALARSRRRRVPEPPHVTDADFEAEVLQSPLPVLVHFYREWSIGDRVMINQGRRLAERNGDALKVRWLEVEQNPVTLARYPHVQTPAFLFFCQGKCVFHCEGVVDEADVHREMWEAREKYLARQQRPAPSGDTAR